MLIRIRQMLLRKLFKVQLTFICDFHIHTKLNFKKQSIQKCRQTWLKIKNNSEIINQNHDLDLTLKMHIHRRRERKERLGIRKYYTKRFS